MRRENRTHYREELDHILRGLRHCQPENSIPPGSFVRGDALPFNTADLLIARETDGRLADRAGNLVTSCECCIHRETALPPPKRS